MLTAFVALAAVIILSVLFIFALLPRRTMRLSCRQFCGLLFAHRGLWSGRERIPENSLPAFRRAVAAGYAIELDVQLTKDGQAVIFHDNTLHRMCGVQGNVHDYTFLELQQFSLDNTKEKIPLLSQVLQLVNGQVPLLIELKTRRLDISVCPVAAALLENYRGKYCIESFSPLILHWYRKHQPQIIRGQLSCRFNSDAGLPKPLLFLAEHLLFNWYGRPDFIAYEFHRGLTLLNLRILRRCFHTPVFTWTVRSPAELIHSRFFYDSVIFDRFLPVSADFQTNTKE